MGDRVSVQFVKLSKWDLEQYGRKDNFDKSAVLFSHWDGMSLVSAARQFAKKLAKCSKGQEMYPLDRLEPGTVMLHFILDYCRKSEKGNYYVVPSDDFGDNSDNGHHYIDLTDGNVSEMQSLYEPAGKSVKVKKHKRKTK